MHLPCQHVSLAQRWEENHETWRRSPGRPPPCQVRGFRQAPAVAGLSLLQKGGGRHLGGRDTVRASGGSGPRRSVRNESAPPHPLRLSSGFPQGTGINPHASPGPQDRQAGSAILPSLPDAPPPHRAAAPLAIESVLALGLCSRCTLCRDRRPAPTAGPSHPPGPSYVSPPGEARPGHPD